jgi:hypothetical protein
VCFISDSGEIVNTLNVWVRPDDGKYVVSAGALNVNKIYIPAHDRTAISYTDARPKLQEFLKSCFEAEGGRVKPAGWNIRFDLDFIWEYLMPREEWENIL